MLLGLRQDGRTSAAPEAGRPAQVRTSWFRPGDASAGARQRASLRPPESSVCFPLFAARFGHTRTHATSPLRTGQAMQRSCPLSSPHSLAKRARGETKGAEKSKTQQPLLTEAEVDC